MEPIEVASTPLNGVWVYTPYITRNGKRIYRKNGKVFKFFVPTYSDK